MNGRMTPRWSGAGGAQRGPNGKQVMTGVAAGWGGAVRGEGGGPRTKSKVHRLMSRAKTSKN